MRFHTAHVTARQSYDRSVMLRVAAGGWIGLLLAPFIVAGTFLVVLDNLSWLCPGNHFRDRAFASLVADGAVGAAWSPRWERCPIFSSRYARATTACGDECGPAVTRYRLIADMNLLTDDLRSGKRKRTETSAPGQDTRRPA